MGLASYKLVLLFVATQYIYVCLYFILSLYLKSVLSHSASKLDTGRPLLWAYAEIKKIILSSSSLWLSYSGNLFELRRWAIQILNGQYAISWHKQRDWDKYIQGAEGYILPIGRRQRNQTVRSNQKPWCSRDYLTRHSTDSGTPTVEAPRLSIAAYFAPRHHKTIGEHPKKLCIKP